VDDLYQELILDHYAHPRHFGRLANANRRAEGYNPLCGDQVHLELRVEDGVIVDVAFEGSGCAISTAAASLMAEAVAGASEAEALRLRDQLLATVTAAEDEPADVDALGKLAALAGVRNYPMRVKCATLAWHALREALSAPVPNSN
jgi:nitrogen fixation NifU-like protein